MHKDYFGGAFKTMVCIGDSITAGGSAASRELCWVNRLGKLISEFQENRLNVINCGIGANVLVDGGSAYENAVKPAGKERIGRDVVKYDPDLVTLAFGTNDMRGGTAVSRFIEDLEYVISMLKSKTSALIVVLSTYFIVDFGKSTDAWGKANLQLFKGCNREISSCCQRYNILYADVFSAMGEAPWVVDRDNIHPNNLGHILIANKVFEVIATNCSAFSIKAFKDVEKAANWRDESSLMRMDNL